MLGLDAAALRRVSRIATLLLVLLAAFQVAWGIAAWGWAGWYGQDLGFYTDATARLIDTGTWYQDRQLHGPYTIMPGDVLYPPITAILFAPWLVLPSGLFIAIPWLMTLWGIRRLRPAWWAWPLMAACLIWPDTQVKVIAANPGLWVMAALALGASYRWPAAFAILKPTLAPLALIGIRSLGWWMVVAAMVVASLPLLDLTLRYPAVLLDARGGGLYYSLWDIPLAAMPVIAWLAGVRSRRI